MSVKRKNLLQKNKFKVKINLRKERYMIKQINIKKWCGIAAVFAGVVLGGVAVVAANSAPVFADDTDSWGPQDRATFHWDAPASYPVFNSIVDNPDIGNEANFVRVREAGSDANFTDSVNVEVGKEYEVYVYYHNNASPAIGFGEGAAQNVRLKMAIPEKIEKDAVGVVKGTISSTNTNPLEVYDTAYLNATDTVYMRYVDNSAIIHNSGTANGHGLVATALFGDEGAKLAWQDSEDTWGLIPGCNEYAGYVTFRVKADQPLFYITNEISTEGKNTWTTEIKDAKPGETFDFKTHYKNWGTTEQTRVTVCEDGGTGLIPVNGSVKIGVSYSNEVTVANDAMFSKDVCMVVGDFRPGEEFDVTYKMKLSDSEEIFPCDKTVSTHNDVVVATANGTEYDRVKINVTRACGTAATPTVIPETGPAQIALAAVVVIAIIGGGFYLYDSQRRLDKTAKRVGVRGGASRNTTARKASRTNVVRKNTAMKSATRNAMKSTGRGARTAARTSNTAKKLTVAQKAAKSRKK